MKSQLEQRVDAIMQDVPAERRWLPWCPNDGPCGCVGCITMSVSEKITKQMSDSIGE